MEFDNGFRNILKGDHSFREVIQTHPNTINQTNSCGLSYLMAACRLGDTDLIEFLIKAGADLEKSDSDGDTALHYAVIGGHDEVVTMMLSQDLLKLNIGDHGGRTPLLDAVDRCHLGIIHKLTSKGADMNAVDNEGNNCLHLAVKKDAFHSECESLDILDEISSQLNQDRLSGIVVACYLAEQGANFYHRNNDKATPIDIIEDSDLKETLKTFVSTRYECMLCGEKQASVKVHPCGHRVICEECCSKIKIKKCIRCQHPVTSRSRFDGSQVNSSLASEYQKLKDETTCTVCMERRRNMAFDCGHTTCKECGEQLDQCHLCGKQIEDKIIIIQ